MWGRRVGPQVLTGEMKGKKQEAEALRNLSLVPSQSSTGCKAVPDPQGARGCYRDPEIPGGRLKLKKSAQASATLAGALKLNWLSVVTAMAVRRPGLPIF